MKIDVVIINWNSGLHLNNCIQSIDLHGSFYVDGLIVVDNSSTDESADFVKSASNVKFIQARSNLGFGKACNIGAKQTKSDFLLFLNPDAALHADTLPKTLAYMQDPINAKVGICGVQLLDESGHIARSCARFPTPLGFAAHAVGLVRLFPRLGHFMEEWAHDQTREVDHVIGAFYLIRRSVFDQLGGFDERFFVYLEDLDLSYRARQAGWRSVYLAEAQAFHAGGGTSNQIKARRLFYSLRSRLLYAFKHFSVPGALLVLLTTLLVEPLTRTALGLLRRSWPAVKETWGGYAMLWCWLPQWVFKGVTR
jgi:GT2 family glycosyltransferase